LEIEALVTENMRISFSRLWHAVHLSGLTIREAAAQTWRRMDDQAVMSRAAAITFYGMAALVPFMGLVIAISAHALPYFETFYSRRVQLEPVDPVEALLPSDAVSLVKHELNRIQAEPRVGLVSFGLLVLLWLSSSVFVEVIDAMNAIRGLKETRPFWKRRLIAMVMTLGLAGILISATLTLVVWPQILNWLGLGGVASVIATIVHGLVVTMIVFLTFALALQVGPNTAVAWEWITPGSLLGSIVMVAASVLFRVYAQNWGHYGATYGSLAGIMLLMSWLWLSSLVLLVAAVFNKVIEDASHLKSFGTGIAVNT
jgi:membrane protein